jgi:hypothetical protein
MNFWVICFEQDWCRLLKDPLEGISTQGMIQTGVSIDRIPALYSPIVEKTISIILEVSEKNYTCFCSGVGVGEKQGRCNAKTQYRTLFARHLEYFSIFHRDILSEKQETGFL